MSKRAHKSTRWKTSATTVYNVNYHFVWCPKYRRKVLVDDDSGRVASRLRELLFDKCIEHDLIIDTLEVMPDHVHLFVKAKPIHAPHYIMQQLKGATSHALRNEFPHLRSRIPTLWTRSYYVESVGHISEATIRRYIEDQKRS